MDEFEGKRIIYGVIHALCFLHARQICHRDVTNNNVIYDATTGSVKLFDFSVSKQLHSADELLWTQTGSLAFMAPEIFTDSAYSKAVDVWSLGVVTHSILTGYLPFY